jgi:hypothetical protein
MIDEQYARIRAIQETVRAMAAERELAAKADRTAKPSRYWEDFCGFFDYVIDLPPRAFAKLRLHTYHLTGDNYQTYYFGNRSAFLDYWGPWLEHGGEKPLPPSHIISEPDNGIGFRLEDGRLVSQDTARFQRSIRSLSSEGLLGARSSVEAPLRVVEIGAGYGGMALHISRIVGNCRYVIVDLPETLLFSAAYLTLQAPERRLYLYRPGDRDVLDVVREFDFVLVPNYRLADLKNADFELAINVASLQEMRVEQVEEYLGFLQATCRGVFYSCNRDHQTSNNELPGLFDLIQKRFEMRELPPLSGRPRSWRARTRSEVRRQLRRVAQRAGLLERGNGGPGPDPFPFVEHLCRARSLATAGLGS